MKYHLMAAFTALVWGSTVVASKVLLDAGLTPAEIMTCRFILAYILLWILYPHKHRIDDWHDEFIFFLMGFFGGTLYFLSENTALYYTQSTNVALICATVPIITALFSHFFIKGERFTPQFFIGATIAFIGVALVILNGTLVLKLNPMGDLLTCGAVLCWTIYCVVQKKLNKKYNMLLVTRNIFFYGLATMVPYLFLFESHKFPTEELSNPVVWGNLCFLGIIASGVCYYLFNSAIDNLGVITTNKYIYLLPLVTIIISSIVLDERITLYTIIGTALIISGLWSSSITIKKRREKE